jgi:hypothetical protein
MVWCLDGEETYNPSLWVEGQGHGSLRVIRMDFPAGKFTKIVFGRMYDVATNKCCVRRFNVKSKVN